MASFLFAFAIQWGLAEVPDPATFFGLSCSQDSSGGHLICTLPSGRGLPIGDPSETMGTETGLGASNGSSSGTAVIVGGPGASGSSSPGGFGSTTARDLSNTSESLRTIFRDLDQIANEVVSGTNRVVNDPQRLAAARTLAEEALRIESESRSALERAASLKPEKEKYFTFKTPIDRPEWRALRKIRERQVFTRRWLENQDHSIGYKGLRHYLLSFTDVLVAAADEAYAALKNTYGDAYLERASTALDLVVDFTPGVSLVKDLISITSGINPITLESVSRTEKALILATLAAPAILKGIGKGCALFARFLKDVSLAAGNRGQNAQFLLDVIRQGDDELRVFSHSPLGSEIGAVTDEFVESTADVINSIGPRKFDEILRIPKGQRPPPESYLPESYISSHLEKFDQGAAFLVPKNNLDKYGRELIGYSDDTQFVMPKSTLDDLIKKTGGDISTIEKELGIPSGAWQGKEISRIDVLNPREHGLRLPSGNEMGTNELWLPGGKTATGQYEGVLNRVPKGSYVEKGIDQ